jgi:L-ornithine N5-oxygenase
MIGAQLETNEIYDIVGIGFGPSNLALAIAIDEQYADSGIKACFLEEKSKFGWHPNMLLTGTVMQISFLKDLVTQRNPSSAYTFINYLKCVNRLSDFINLRNFYPSRIEFNEYLAWAAKNLSGYTRYGRRVTSVRPHGAAPHKLFEIVAENTASGEIEHLFAKNIVVAPGGRPSLPFSTRLEQDSKRVWHSSKYLEQIQRFKSDIGKQYHFAVVGRGQSAAEIAYDLHSTFPNARVSCVFRGFGLKPADSSEFVNEVFDSSFIDYIHSASPDLHGKILSEHADTNYSVVDAPLISRLYEIFYAEKVSGKQRLFFRNLSTVTEVREENDAVTIELCDAGLTELQQLQVDAAVLATGYTYPNPPAMLAPLKDYMMFDQHSGNAVVGRHYRVSTDACLTAGIYLQGCNENTHGLSDTLLSNLSIRADEIVNHLLTFDAPAALKSEPERDGRVAALAMPCPA